MLCPQIMSIMWYNNGQFTDVFFFCLSLSWVFNVWGRDKGEWGVGDSLFLSLLLLLLSLDSCFCPQGVCMAGVGSLDIIVTKLVSQTLLWCRLSSVQSSPFTHLASWRKEKREEITTPNTPPHPPLRFLSFCVTAHFTKDAEKFSAHSRNA